MKAEYGCRHRDAGQGREDSCVPPTTETHVEDGREKYKPKARGTGERSDGSNLGLRYVRPDHKLRHNEKDNSVGQPNGGI
jgi:hypothetical protein